MNKPTFDFTERVPPKADHGDDDPSFYSVVPLGRAFTIARENGEYLDPSQLYATEDDAENAIREMEKEWRDNHCRECGRSLDNVCADCAYARYRDGRD